MCPNPAYAREALLCDEAKNDFKADSLKTVSILSEYVQIKSNDFEKPVSGTS